MDSPVMREIAVRFAYLRRVVLAEITRQLTPLGVTPPMYHVLFRLAHDGELQQQDLVLDSGLDAAGVSRIIAKMIDQRLITAKVDPSDRRRRLVRITAKGRRLEESLAPVVDAAVRTVVTGLTHEEETLLLSLLDKAVVATRDLNAARESERPRARKQP